MGEGRSQNRQVNGPTAGNGRIAKSFEDRHIATFARPDLFIVLGLAVITFGIYAQVIRHQFITLDDGWYIKNNLMVNRGVTLAGLAWAFTTFWPAVAHLLHTLCRGKLTKLVCMDCPNTCAGASGQTGAGDLAVRNVAPRLLAVAPFSTIDTPEELLRLDCATAAREIAALCHCSCFLCHHFFCPGSFRRCSHILRRSNCVTIIE